MNIQKVFDNLTQTPMTIPGWLAGFGGIVFVRFLLENLSNPSSSGSLTTDAATLVHYALFYLAATLLIALILHWFSGKPALAVMKFTLFGLLITWLPPLIDLAARGGQGSVMAYLFSPKPLLWQQLISFFGPLTLSGITLGIRIEVAIICLVAGLFVYSAKRQIVVSVLAALAVYAVLFVLLALPAVVGLMCVSCQTGSSVLAYWHTTLASSAISLNFLHPTIRLSESRAFEIYFDVAMAQLFYLLALAAGMILAWRAHKNAVIHIWKNSRFLRVIHYFLLIVLGMLLAQAPAMSRNWVLATTLIMLFLSFYFSWMFAVGTNDIADVGIDQISNQDRPLVTGSVNAEVMKGYNWIFLLLSLTAGFLAGHNTFFLVLAFTAVYYVYSMPPLRLKRIIGLSVALVALAGVCAAMAGFLFWNWDKSVSAIPLQYALLLFLVLFLTVNFKDLKDVDGDRQEGILTVPVLLGKRTGTTVVLVLWLIAGALGAVIIGHWWLSILLAVMLAWAQWRIISKGYNERIMFAVYYAYVLLCAGVVVWLK